MTTSTPRGSSSFDHAFGGMLITAAALIWLLWIPCELWAGLLR